MALVISSPNDIVSSNPTIELRTALQDFEAALTHDQVQTYKTSSTQPTAEGAILFVATIAAKNQGSHGQFLWKKLCPFLDATRQFTGIVNQFVSSNPNIAGLVWGGIRTTLLVAENAASYFDQVTNLLMEIGRLSPTLTEFGHLYIQHVGLQSALCRYYTVIVRVCTKIVADLRRNTTSHLFATVFSPFALEFKPHLEALTRAKDGVLLQVSLADKQSRLEQHKLEMSENSKHRHSFSKLRSDVKKENEAMVIYREKQLELRAKAMKDGLKRNLSDINYIKAWRQALQPRIEGTAEWFRVHEGYRLWKASPITAVLWCRGTLGVGKTVFVSSIVADLLEHRSPEESIAFYFCRSDHESSLQARSIIGTIARQLTGEAIDALDMETLERPLGECKDPAVDDILDFTLRHLDHDRFYYIVIDGLDECTNQNSRIVQQTISKLCIRYTGRIKVLYSARPDLRDDHNLHGSPAYAIMLNGNIVQNDIDKYIETAIDQCCEDEKLKLTNSRLRLEIIEALKRDSDGMFLWARLFIGDLCACASDHEIKQALTRPPKSLSGLISGILHRIKADSAEEHAHNILRYCGVAKRPMSVMEMREVLSVQEGQTLLDRDKMPNDMGKIVSVCRGLVFVDEVDETLHYVHHSLTTYLFGTAEPALGVFDHDPSDTLLGAKCLTYVCFGDFQRQLKKAYGTSTARIQPIRFGTTAVSSSRFTKWRTRKLLAEPQTQLNHIRLGELHNQATDILTEQKSSALQGEAGTQGYHFLKYAKQHWIEHLSNLEKDRSPLLWDLFTSVIRRDDTPALKPWESAEHRGSRSQEQDVPPEKQQIRWAVYNNNSALLSTQLPATSMDTMHELGRLLTFTVSNSELKRVSKLISKSLGALTIARSLPDVQQALSGYLETAIQHDNQDLLAHLLECGIDEMTSFMGRSALEIASSAGSVTAVQQILATGINVNSSFTATPLEVAVSHQRSDIVAILLKAGADRELHLRDQSPLMAAIKLRSFRIVELLIDSGADVNVKADNLTPLVQAAMSGRFETVQKLITAGAMIDPYGVPDTPLLAAIGKGHVDVVRLLLLKGAKVNQNVQDLKTPLVIAIECDNLEIARLLLGSGAAVNMICPACTTGSPLLTAVHRGSLPAFDLLVSSGADINLPVGPRTPLLLAIKLGRDEMVDKLLALGANVNLCTGYYTPLIAAISRQDGTMVHKLLRAGADVNLFSETSSPLSAAVRTGKVKLIRALLAAGADSKLTPPVADGPLLLDAYFASLRGFPDLCMDMIDLGIDVDANKGITVLGHAAYAGDLDLILRLIEAGADVNLNPSSGTALSHAATAGRIKVVKALIEAGAYVNTARELRQHPIILAAHNGHLEVVEVLLAAKDGTKFLRVLQEAIKRAESVGHDHVASILNTAMNERDPALPDDSMTEQTSTEAHHGENDFNDSESTIGLAV